MAVRTFVFGPGLNTGRSTRSAEKALAALAADPEVEVVTVARDKGEPLPSHMRDAYQALLTCERLVLLHGWEEVEEACVLGQVALSMNLDVLTLVDLKDLQALSHDSVTAPLLPGQGVLAPDSDKNELPHEEAARIVLGPRGAFYDTPLRNLGRTGIIWTGILYNKLKPGSVISAEEVALCMVGMKISRETFRHKRDNITDSHGYLMIIDMIREERERTGEPETDAGI